MKYHELKLTRQKTALRRGRGISAGRGKTAGRGTKGQNSRKSGGVRPGFEGGQMPLYMRLPKLRGFRSFHPKAEVVFTQQLNSLTKSTIDQNTLYEAGLISGPQVRAKLLFRGEVTGKKNVKLASASARAINAIKKAGGSFEPTKFLAQSSQKNSQIET